jgi:hypothetical protein
MANPSELERKEQEEQPSMADIQARARDRILGHLNIAERLMHKYFGSVGVQSLDDARKALIDESMWR